MNAIKLVITLLTVTGMIFVQSMNNQNQVSGEEIIQTYLESIQIDIQPNTDEYRLLMRGILLGEYPELTGNNSVFISNQTDLSLVLNYASENSGFNELYGIYDEPNEPEAISSENTPRMQFPLDYTLSLGQSMAVEYAYTWSISGGISRNSEYPDFGDDDCTNFISQAMKAGRFLEVGSGDGCQYEDTSTEWYVNPNSNPPLWCLGDFREWEWSTGWSVPWPFRDYFAYQNYFANIPGWTTSVSTAKYYLSPGDLIQLQYQDNEGNWITYHTMIITSEDIDDLYLTYHSNHDGFDEVDKPLSSIPTDSTHRFMLISIFYPEMYMPVVINESLEELDKNNENYQYLNPIPYPYPFPVQSPFLGDGSVTPYPLQ